MSIVAEIKQRVEKLNPKQQAELRAWFLERDWTEWDRQIADDPAAGRLDDLISEAEADRAAGRAREL
jgi:hypothetical protein